MKDDDNPRPGIDNVVLFKMVLIQRLCVLLSKNLLAFFKENQKIKTILLTNKFYYHNIKYEFDMRYEFEFGQH